MRLLGFALCVSGMMNVAEAAPKWASFNSPREEQGLLKVICSGSGPSAGLARKEALNDCWASAAQVLSSEISVKSLSATSERQAIYQQEVVNLSHIQGLNCTPKKEALEQVGDQLTVWLLCEFDVKKAKAIHEADAHVSDFSIAEELPIANDPLHHSADSDSRVVVNLATVPKCQDVIVLGRGPARTLPCHRNPMPILIAPEDSEIVVRAQDHFPKSVFLGPRREVRGYVQVVLRSNQ